MIAAFNGLSLLVRFATVAGVVLFIVGSIAVYNESQKMKGEARVIERSQKQGKANERKAAKAHERARAPGAADRLRRDACRDCD
jgi:hypothetical protein